MKLGVIMKYFLMLLLITPMPAVSASWTLLSVSDESELEIDSASVRDKKAAWFRATYNPPQKNMCADEKKEIQLQKFYVEAKCKEFVIRIKQNISYEPNEEVACSYDNPKGEFAEYAPETQGETYFNAICSTQGRKQDLLTVTSKFLKEKNIFIKNEPCPSSSVAEIRYEGYSIEFNMPPCIMKSASATSFMYASNFKWVKTEDLNEYHQQQKVAWGCK